MSSVGLEKSPYTASGCVTSHSSCYVKFCCHFTLTDIMPQVRCVTLVKYNLYQCKLKQVSVFAFTSSHLPGQSPEFIWSISARPSLYTNFVTILRLVCWSTCHRTALQISFCEFLQGVQVSMGFSQV